MHTRDREIERKVLELTDQMIQAALSAGLLEGEAKQQHMDQAVRSVSELAGLLIEVLQGREEHLEALLYQLAAQKLPDKRILESFGNFSQDLNTIMTEGLNLFRRLRAESSEVAPEQLAEQEPEPAWTPSETVKMPAATPGSEPSQDWLQNPGEQVVGISERVEETPEKVQQTIIYGKPAGLDYRSYPEVKDAKEDVVLHALHSLYPGEDVLKGFLFHGIFLDYFLPEAKLGVMLKNGGAFRRQARLEYFCNKEGVALIWVTKEEASNLKVFKKKLKERSLNKS